MKQNRRNGFTLAELLVVVAIIGVLVAIAIPTFTAQLKKAKIATDDANIRSAYAIFRACEVTDTIEIDGVSQAPADGNYFLTPGGSLTKDASRAYVLQEDHPDCKLFSSESGGAFKHTKGTKITITYTATSDSWSFSPTPAANT